MVSVDWKLTAATTIGAVFAVGVAVTSNITEATNTWALVPTAVGVAAGYVAYRIVNDDGPLADALV